jgi:hypothetical protein
MTGFPYRLLMVVIRTTLLLAAVLLAWPAHAADGPTGSFDALLEVTTSQGTRSLNVTIEVLRPMSVEEAAGLKSLLDKDGQQALLNAVRGSWRGRLFLGGVEFPLEIVVAEQSDDGWRYAVVTPRNLRWDEIQLEEPSVDFPFAVAVFEVPEMGSGEGKIAPKASIAIGADGKLTIERFEGESGRMKNVRRR